MRFGLVWRGDGSVVETAKRAEDAGYARLLFPDHTGMVAPMPAMAAAAAVTSRIEIGPQVINIAFRPLGALAQEAAAIDVISGGRLLLGLGAGYAEQEVRSLGLPFPGNTARIRAVARALDVLPRLFAGETVTDEEAGLVGFSLDPKPPQGAAVPTLVGGNGDRMLAVAARGARIVQFTGFTTGATQDQHHASHFTTDGLAQRLAYVRGVAGDRFPELALSLLVQHARVVADRRAAIEELLADSALPVPVALDSPFMLFGSVDELCDRIQELRERFGISYLTVFDGRNAGFDQVVSRLA